MNDKDFVELFEKDCKYYDKKHIELNSIISLVDFKKNDRLIDVGSGIGRLAIPLCKYVKVTAIDIDKALIDQIKDLDITVIHSKIEDYYPENKFDYALIAWPSALNYAEIFEHIKKNILEKNGKLLIIKSLEHDLKKVSKKLFPEIFGKSDGFLKVLPDFFTIEKEKIIETEWIYPNSDEALKLILFELSAFYNKEVTDEQIEIIKEFIREHEKSGKVYMDAKLKVLLCK